MGVKVRWKCVLSGRYIPQLASTTSPRADCPACSAVCPDRPSPTSLHEPGNKVNGQTDRVGIYVHMYVPTLVPAKILRAHAGVVPLSSAFRMPIRRHVVFEGLPKDRHARPPSLIRSRWYVNTKGSERGCTAV